MAGTNKDYYKILGVNRDADDDAIKTAFRKLAKLRHPDVDRDNPNAGAQFREIYEAYDVLSDAKKRAIYDRDGTFYKEGESYKGKPPSYDDLFKRPLTEKEITERFKNITVADAIKNIQQPDFKYPTYWDNSGEVSLHLYEALPAEIQKDPSVQMAAIQKGGSSQALRSLAREMKEKNMTAEAASEFLRTPTSGEEINNFLDNFPEEAKTAEVLQIAVDKAANFNFSTIRPFITKAGPNLTPQMAITLLQRVQTDPNDFRIAVSVLPDNIRTSPDLINSDVFLNVARRTPDYNAQDFAQNYQEFINPDVAQVLLKKTPPAQIESLFMSFPEAVRKDPATIQLTALKVIDSDPASAAALRSTFGEDVTPEFEAEFAAQFPTIAATPPAPAPITPTAPDPDPITSPASQTMTVDGHEYKMMLDSKGNPLLNKNNLIYYQSVENEAVRMTVDGTGHVVEQLTYTRNRISGRSFSQNANGGEELTESYYSLDGSLQEQYISRVGQYGNTHPSKHIICRSDGKIESMDIDSNTRTIYDQDGVIEARFSNFDKATGKFTNIEGYKDGKLVSHGSRRFEQGPDGSSTEILRTSFYDENGDATHREEITRTFNDEEIEMERVNQISTTNDELVFRQTRTRENPYDKYFSEIETEEFALGSGQPTRATYEFRDGKTFQFKEKRDGHAAYDDRGDRIGSRRRHFDDHGQVTSEEFYPPTGAPEMEVDIDQIEAHIQEYEASRPDFMSNEPNPTNIEQSAKWSGAKTAGSVAGKMAGGGMAVLGIYGGLNELIHGETKAEKSKGAVDIAMGGTVIGEMGASARVSQLSKANQLAKAIEMERLATQAAETGLMAENAAIVSGEMAANVAGMAKWTKGLGAATGVLQMAGGAFELYLSGQRYDAKLAAAQNLKSFDHLKDADGNPFLNSLPINDDQKKSLLAHKAEKELTAERVSAAGNILAGALFVAAIIFPPAALALVIAGFAVTIGAMITEGIMKVGVANLGSWAWAGISGLWDKKGAQKTNDMLDEKVLSKMAGDKDNLTLSADLQKDVQEAVKNNKSVEVKTVNDAAVKDSTQNQKAAADTTAKVEKPAAAKKEVAPAPKEDVAAKTPDPVVKTTPEETKSSPTQVNAHTIVEPVKTDDNTAVDNTNHASTLKKQLARNKTVETPVTSEKKLVETPNHPTTKTHNGSNHSTTILPKDTAKTLPKDTSNQTSVVTPNDSSNVTPSDSSAQKSVVKKDSPAVTKSNPEPVEANSALMMQVAKMQKLMAKADTDGDGKITAEEMKAMNVTEAERKKIRHSMYKVGVLLSKEKREESLTWKEINDGEADPKNAKDTEASIASDAIRRVNENLFNGEGFNNSH